jgi:hypothetical protein
MLERLKRLWMLARKAKEAVEWGQILVAVLGLLGILPLILGVLYQQSPDIIALYVVAAIAFVLVIVMQFKVEVLDLLGSRHSRLATAQRHRTEAEFDSGSALSEAARELLLQAVEDRAGVIMRLGSLSGGFVETNGRNFVQQGSKRSAAQWRSAVDELHRCEFLEDRAGKGEVFYVTEHGYAAADLLRSQLGDGPPDAQ